VAGALVGTAPAKINLTLRVLARRADGYHDLESLVAFANLSDTLTLQLGGSDALEVTGPFEGPSGPVSGNLVLKALAAMRQRIDGLIAGHFRLEKNIPVAAGLGGGSADAAAALRLLARANDITLDDSRLCEAALEIGADVPVCIASQARIMRGVGEMLSPPLDLPPMSAILVNPGISLATRDVFARFSASASNSKPIANPPSSFDALIEWLAQYDNDLTKPASAYAPVIVGVLSTLNASKGVLLARMSGSGACCFALFSTGDEAAAAARLIQAEHKDWWVCAVTIGSRP